MSTNLALLEKLDAFRELFEIVTKADIASLREHCEDEDDVAGSLVGILYDAEIDNPEWLLERCGILHDADDAEERLE